jgi:hypothetical protein
LRERAVNSPRDAEVLLRWWQAVRPPEATPGVDLDALSEAQLERLHAGLVKLASMDDTWETASPPGPRAIAARSWSPSLERREDGVGCVLGEYLRNQVDLRADSAGEPVAVTVDGLDVRCS